MSFKTKILALTGFLVAIGIIIYPYYKDYKDLKRKEKIAPVLKPGEKVKVIKDKNKVIIVDKDETVIRHNPRDTVITVTDDGKVDVYAPIMGFIFEPGYCGFYTDDKFWIGIDSQWFYWRYLGINSGIGLTTSHNYLKLRLNVVSLSYTPSWKYMTNTSIYAGLNDKSDFLVGIRAKW